MTFQRIATRSILAQLVGISAAAAVLAAVPAVANRYVLVVLVTANVYAVLAMSWDLMAGYTGLMSFGHAAFFGVSGYVTTFSYMIYKLGPAVSILLGAAAAILLSLLIGVTCLRLRGVYLGLLTLAVPLVFGTLVLIFSPITRGETGYHLAPPLFGSVEISYYSSLIFMLATLISLLVISRSRIGIMFKTIREDEDAAESIGVDTFRYKLLAFVLSAFFAGTAGAFYVHMLQIVLPSFFSLNLSFYAILMPAIGGIGTIFGGVIGAYVLQALDEGLRISQEYALLIEAVMFVLILRFAPSGVIQRIVQIAIEGWRRIHRQGGSEPSIS